MKIFVAVLHKILNVCKLVPMLPIVIVSALPIALLWDFRPWDKPFWFVDGLTRRESSTGCAERPYGRYRRKERR